MGQERAPSFLPTLVKFEFRLVQLFGLWIEVDVRRPWLLHVLEHSGLSACRTSLSATTLGVIAHTSDVSRDRCPSGIDCHWVSALSVMESTPVYARRASRVREVEARPPAGFFVQAANITAG